MEQAPRWSLTSIYPGVESKEFAQDLERMGKIEQELLALLPFSGQQEFTTWFSQVLNHFELALDVAGTLMAYAYAKVSVDTSDEKFLRALNQVEEAALGIQNAYVKVLNALAKEEKQVRAALAEPQFAKYHFVINEALEEQRYLMSEAEENLANDLNRSGGDAWSRLQQAISSTGDSLWDAKSNERKTVIQLRSMAFDANRSVRQRAFEQELAVWKQHEVAFAYALNGVKGTAITLDKRRGYKSPLQKATIQSRITDKSLAALIGAIEDNLEMFQRYLRIKAQLLGVKKLAFFDLFAPVGSANKRYSFSEARDFIVDKFSAFYQPLGEFAAMAFEKQWIDGESRAKKVGGAYCTSFPLRREARVLCNFDHSFDSVITIAHELGHAYHDHVTNHLPALQRQYPMPLAETASIFSQIVVFEGALIEANDEDRLALIEGFLQDSTQVCVDILSRFYFEKELFERREKGELTADQLCAMMVDAQKRSYGSALDENYLHPWMWAVKSHYYRPSLAFYNFPYAFGQLFGQGIYQKAKGRADFGKHYDNILRATGAESAKTVAQLADCDIEDKNFWQSSLDLIASYVDEFEKLANGR